MFFELSFLLVLCTGCNASGDAKVSQNEDDSGQLESSEASEGIDTGTSEPSTPADTAEEEPSSEPGNVPVDQDGDGVFEDDCNDEDPTIYPQADEICDNKDNNCDGEIDENDVCPCPYRSFESKGYYFCGRAEKWRNAVDDCIALGAMLVSISSLEENTYIAEQANTLTDGKWWIGLNDRDSEGVYEWDNGAELSFESWNEGEPNNYDGSENCIEMYSNNGLWNDVQCRNQQGFICSFPLD